MNLIYFNSTPFRAFERYSNKSIHLLFVITNKHRNAMSINEYSFTNKENPLSIELIKKFQFSCELNK